MILQYGKKNIICFRNCISTALIEVLSRSSRSRSSSSTCSSSGCSSSDVRLVVHVHV